jgi:hypothetical protein
MNPDPWIKLDLPRSKGTVTARRVDSDIAWNFFWARDTAGKCLLLLKHTSAAAPDAALPKLRGIEVDLSHEPNDECMLTFRLLDSSHRDIFFRLCQDIVSSASAAETEKTAVVVTLQRTWRWHHLLRGGSDQRLSEEEQKGLIGELLVLERYLLPHLTAQDAIASWHGPLLAPKDFEIGQVCVEAKARRPGASPSVVINSEHQLDDTDLKGLVLAVVTLDRAAAESSGRFTVTDVAVRVRDEVQESNPSALAEYESRLTAAGFRWADDYSDSSWVEGQATLYRVTGHFPRIAARDLVPGVQHVKYSISLVECQPYLIPESELLALLKGA